jgi:transcriptional regulator with XRE-family HTH domain
MEILSLGEKIKRKRKELNMTLKDLAKDRITPGQISLVESGRSNPSMDLLEYLSINLNTTVEYLMESEESQAEKISTYYSQMAESYIISEKFNLGEVYIEKALLYAEKYNLEYRKGKILFLRAKTHISNKELSLAQQLLLSSNVIFIKNNKYEEIVQTFLNLGIITLGLKAYHSANSYLRQAEKVYLDNNIGDDYIIGEIYYYMAKTFFAVENIAKAKEYTCLARDKFNGIYDKENYAESLLQISEEYNKKDDLVNAIKYSNKTLEVHEEINHLKNISKIENNLGKLFYNFENLGESFKRYELAKETISKKDKNERVETILNICKNHIKLKNINECEDLLQDVYHEITEENVEGKIEYNLLRSRVYMIKEQFDEAESVLIQTYKYSKSKDMLKRAGELAIILGKHFMDKKQMESATEYLDQGVAIFRELKIIEN